jgi:hypothetical protein
MDRDLPVSGSEIITLNLAISDVYSPNAVFLVTFTEWEASIY